MADGIIDIRAYLDGGEDDDTPAGGAFALWGAEGERSRFALPLWRIVYLAGGDRGAIVSTRGMAPSRGRPFVVLDLRTDPPRTDYAETDLPDCGEDPAPVLFDRLGEGLVVYLGTGGGKRWYLVVDGIRERSYPLESRAREDILFLAGECAGLLFFRDLAGS